MYTTPRTHRRDVSLHFTTPLPPQVIESRCPQSPHHQWTRLDASTTHYPCRHDPACRKSKHLDALTGIRAYDDHFTSQYSSTRFDTPMGITSLPSPLDVSLDVDGCDYCNLSHSHHDLRPRKLTLLLGVNMHHNTKNTPPPPYHIGASNADAHDLHTIS